MSRTQPSCKGEQRESADCPAERHRHSIRGWYIDGCRCPSTQAAREVKRNRMHDWRQEHRPSGQSLHQVERQRLAALPLSERYREIDECTAARHHVPGGGRWRAWHDGCRCPSTVKAYERRLETMREAGRRLRQRRSLSLAANHNVAQFNLALANRLDAEAIAQGYHLTQRCSIHTRALAVAMMIRANPKMTDRQVSWRLTNAGQGRMVSHRGAPPAYEAVSVRNVQRIIAGLLLKDSCRDIAAMDRTDYAR